MAASSSYAGEVRARVKDSSANCAILSFSDDFEEPRSWQGEGISIEFVGRFTYDPQARREGAPRWGAAIRLVSGPVQFEGAPTEVIRLDERGLMIGRESPYGRSLDISQIVPDVADSQVRASMDPQGVWSLRDFGANGLTMALDAPLDEQTWVPTHGSRFSVGTVEFEWIADS